MLCFGWKRNISTYILEQIFVHYNLYTGRDNCEINISLCCIKPLYGQCVNATPKINKLPIIYKIQCLRVSYTAQIHKKVKNEQKFTLTIYITIIT